MEPSARSSGACWSRGRNERVPEKPESCPRLRAASQLGHSLPQRPTVRTKSFSCCPFSIGTVDDDVVLPKSINRGGATPQAPVRPIPHDAPTKLGTEERRPPQPNTTSWPSPGCSSLFTAALKSRSGREGVERVSRCHFGVDWCVWIVVGLVVYIAIIIIIRFQLKQSIVVHHLFLFSLNQYNLFINSNCGGYLFTSPLYTLYNRHHHPTCSIHGHPPSLYG